MHRYGALEGVSKPELATELGEEQVLLRSHTLFFCYSLFLFTPLLASHTAIILLSPVLHFLPFPSFLLCTSTCFASPNYTFSLSLPSSPLHSLPHLTPPLSPSSLPLPLLTSSPPPHFLSPPHFPPLLPSLPFRSTTRTNRCRYGATAF